MAYCINDSVHIKVTHRYS